VLASVALFIVFLGSAMVLYPGGTWMDRSTHGYDFARNFFCDLLAGIALNGEPNPGSELAKIGILALALGLVPFWLLVPRLFAGRLRLGAAVRALGLASAAALPLVPLLPSASCGSLHVVTVFVAAIPGIVAAALATVALLASPLSRCPHGYLAGSMFLVAVIDGALYTEHIAAGGPTPPWTLPALQKLAALLLLAFLVTASIGVRRRIRAAPDSDTPP
jgi:hypothetical protein